MGRVTFILIMGILMMPAVQAADPFTDPTCIDASTCYAPGTCVTFPLQPLPAACTPRGCGPVECQGRAPETNDCAINETISGETCQTVVGVGAGSGANEVDLAVVLSDGKVNAFKLPNTWTSPSAEGRIRSGGVDSGQFSLGVYTTTITTPGPRGGPLGLVSASPDHQYDQTAIIVHKGTGTTGSETLIVSVVFLDSVPEGCYARTAQTSVVECPRISESLP